MTANLFLSLYVCMHISCVVVRRCSWNSFINQYAPSTKHCPSFLLSEQIPHAYVLLRLPAGGRCKVAPVSPP